MTVRCIAVAAHDGEAQGGGWRQRERGKIAADFRAQRPGGDALPVICAELVDPLDIPVPVAALAMRPQTDAVPTFSPGNPAEAGSAVAIAQIIDVESGQRCISAPQRLCVRGGVVETGEARLDWLYRQQADDRPADPHIGARPVEGERDVGTVAGADDPFRAEREHLASGPQCDRPDLRLRKALEQVDTALVDRTGGGGNANGIGCDRLDEGPEFADMQVGIGHRAPP